MKIKQFLPINCSQTNRKTDFEETTIFNAIMVYVMDNTIKRIAAHRIQTLFTLAAQTSKENHFQSQRYVRQARKIAMSAKTRLPTEIKRRICKHCKNLMTPGTNCQVRIKQQREPHITITCFECGKHTRIPLKKRSKTQR
jgi:ribonuclease P protein subunit RPR2